MSYAALYGSNGERDYMRQVALDALKERPTATKGPSPPAKTASAFAGKVDDEPSFFTDSTGAIDFGPASPEAKGAIYTSGLTLTDEDKKDILGDDQ